MKNAYDDIIDLPHPTSQIHPRMSAAARSAQFSPFAALTGYDAAIKETARLTDEKPELDEYEIAALNEKLQAISQRLAERPEVVITYFRPDARKAGGACVSATGVVRKLLAHERVVVMEDGSEIAIEEIIQITGALFED